MILKVRHRKNLKNWARKSSTLALLSLFILPGILAPIHRVNAASCVLQGNTITVDCEFAPGTYYYNGTFTVDDGVTVAAGSAASPGQVIIIADDFAISGAISANGLGSAGMAGSCPGSSGIAGGGGCHGGEGGRGKVSTTAVSGGATVYGSASEPVDIGSGGGDDSNTGGTQSGAGGGAVKLVTYSATGTLGFGASGSVTADGANSSSIEAGGGAGGSVWIDVGIYDVQNGSVTANGGNGTGSGTSGGGGGSGGRVAIHYASASGTPIQARQAFGGNRGTTTSFAAQPGAPGTLFVWDKDEYGGDLTIDAN
ncbi:MAG TPA: hypothetical protein VFI22_07485, partial [Thermomicrobiales bacterium]|nr:hypothetical protein [Thermomicrobiales bacterium]